MLRTTYEAQRAEQIETERQLRHGTGKIVSRKFGRVAKFLWPVKTAAHLASIAKTNERTAARWLAGEFQPPVCVVLATMREIFEDEE